MLSRTLGDEVNLSSGLVIDGISVGCLPAREHCRIIPRHWSTSRYYIAAYFMSFLLLIIMGYVCLICGFFEESSLVSKDTWSIASAGNTSERIYVYLTKYYDLYEHNNIFCNFNLNALLFL